MESGDWISAGTRGGLPHLQRLSLISPMNQDVRTLFVSPDQFPEVRELVLVH